MLQELRIENLGVIEKVNLVLEGGLIALTGETGAGKTMIVEAISLLVGERADTTVIRSGASEATVEGRFIVDDEELVVTRVVPTDGRSRAYVNGRLATVAQLSDVGSRLVDLHGQHAHQSLLGAAQQRAAVDAFGHIDLTALEAARHRVTEIDAALATLGGDERQRAREIDLLSFQVEEIDAAGIQSPQEDDELRREEELLAHATSMREALWAAINVLSDEDGAIDRLGDAMSRLGQRDAFDAFVLRLRGLQNEVGDLSSEMRSMADDIEEDPQRLSAARERINLLSELKRKYGDRLADVIDYVSSTRERLAELVGYEERAATLEKDREGALGELARQQTVVLNARRAVAGPLAEACQKHLRKLAMPNAVVAIDVQGDAGEQVTFLLSANPGSHPLPLTKVASGGELARTMLALRLVLTEGPSTLVFDEVDAGIGGEAAVAVGAALGEIAERHQVFVVTHLAQVAANANQHLRVEKTVRKGATFAGVTGLSAADRVGEIARMLSGASDDPAALAHATSLLKARSGGKRAAR
ncbi:MAG: DNA repair protein RecN [Ilumatobacteraceae bacterium]